MNPAKGRFQLPPLPGKKSFRFSCQTVNFPQKNSGNAREPRHATDPRSPFQRRKISPDRVAFSQHQNAKSYAPIACEQDVGKLPLKRIF
jgi:hypothetical protein